jgi:hypothetical protein
VEGEVVGHLVLEPRVAKLKLVAVDLEGEQRPVEGVESGNPTKRFPWYRRPSARPSRKPMPAGASTCFQLNCGSVYADPQFSWNRRPSARLGVSAIRSGPQRNCCRFGKSSWCKDVVSICLNWRRRATAVLHLAIPRRAAAVTTVAAQIAKANAPNAAASRWSTGDSTASS